MKIHVEINSQEPGKGIVIRHSRGYIRFPKATTLVIDDTRKYDGVLERMTLERNDEPDTIDLLEDDIDLSLLDVAGY